MYTQSEVEKLIYEFPIPPFRQPHLYHYAASLGEVFHSNPDRRRLNHGNICALLDSGKVHVMATDLGDGPNVKAAFNWCKWALQHPERAEGDERLSGLCGSLEHRCLTYMGAELIRDLGRRPITEAVLIDHHRDGASTRRDLPDERLRATAAWTPGSERPLNRDLTPTPGLAVRSHDQAAREATEERRSLHPSLRDKERQPYV